MEDGTISMYIYLFIYLFVYLFICLFIYLILPSLSPSRESPGKEAEVALAPDACLCFRKINSGYTRTAEFPIKLAMFTPWMIHC